MRDIPAYVYHRRCNQDAAFVFGRARLQSMHPTGWQSQDVLRLRQHIDFRHTLASQGCCSKGKPVGR